MKKTNFLKYECVHHEVYFSENLNDLTPRPATPSDKGFFPKIKPIENWGTNKIFILNEQKEKIKDFVIPKETGFDLQKIKYIRIDITIEASGLLEISNIDTENLKKSESLNGLVTKISDSSNKVITLKSDYFEGELKDKFGFKTVYYKLEGTKFKSIKVSS